MDFLIQKTLALKLLLLYD